MVVIEQQAVFSCLHSSTYSFTAWKLNGSDRAVRETNPPPGITPGRTLDEKGNVIDYTLTMVAHLNYNQTEVVCVATFVGNSMPEVETTPVILLIQGN